MATKLTISPEIEVALLEQDHTVVINNKEALIFKCSLCGGTKDVIIHTDREPIPYSWMQTCGCGTAKKAPNSGVDAMDLLSQLKMQLDTCHSVDDVRELVARMASNLEMRKLQ